MIPILFKYIQLRFNLDLALGGRSSEPREVITWFLAQNMRPHHALFVQYFLRSLCNICAIFVQYLSNIYEKLYLDFLRKNTQVKCYQCIAMVGYHAKSMQYLWEVKTWFQTPQCNLWEILIWCLFKNMRCRNAIFVFHVAWKCFGEGPPKEDTPNIIKPFYETPHKIYKAIMRKEEEFKNSARRSETCAKRECLPIFLTGAQV